MIGIKHFNHQGFIAVVNAAERLGDGMFHKSMVNKPDRVIFLPPSIMEDYATFSVFFEWDISRISSGKTWARINLLNRILSKLNKCGEPEGLSFWISKIDDIEFGVHESGIPGARKPTDPMCVLYLNVRMAAAYDNGRSAPLSIDAATIADTTGDEPQ